MPSTVTLRTVYLFEELPVIAPHFGQKRPVEGRGVPHFLQNLGLSSGG